LSSPESGKKNLPKAKSTSEIQNASSASWWLSPWQENKDVDPDAGWDSQNEDSPWHELDGSSDSSIEEIFSAIEYEYEELRSRARVRELAEVFTHQREVDAILDLFPDAFVALDIKFLEPTCGSGNFVVEILRRKLKLVTKSSCSSREQYEFKLLRAVGSIYGIDISPENVTEVRVRVANEILGYFQNDSNTVEPSIGFLSCLNLIISENFVLGDSLNNANEIQLIEWAPKPGGYFQRIQSCALVPESERDLFWEEKVLDPEPVHFSSLGNGNKPKKSPAKKKVK
jgi:hypothetical protein